MTVEPPSFREELIDGITKLLGSHNLQDGYTHRCTCGFQLWKTGGSTTMTRHRAEVLVNTYKLAELMAQRA